MNFCGFNEKNNNDGVQGLYKKKAESGRKGPRVEVGGGRCKAEGEQLEKARSGPHQVGVPREIAGLVVLSDPEGKIRPLHTTPRKQTLRGTFTGEKLKQRGKVDLH